MPTGFRNQAIFVTALDNGLRASELNDTAISQLDIKNGYVKVLRNQGIVLQYLSNLPDLACPNGFGIDKNTVSYYDSPINLLRVV